MKQKPTVEEILSNFAKDIRNGYAKDGRTAAKQALDHVYADIFLELVSKCGGEYMDVHEFVKRVKERLGGAS